MAAPATAARQPVTVGVVVKSSTETMRIRLTEYAGHDLVDLRLFDKRCFPTKAGFALQLSHLPAVLEAVEEAILEADRRGLLLPDLVPTRLRRAAPTAPA